MSGLELPPTLRVHPVALHRVRIVNAEESIRLDISDDDDGEIEILVYTATPGAGAPKRRIRIDRAGNIAVYPEQ